MKSSSFYPNASNVNFFSAFRLRFWKFRVSTRRRRKWLYLLTLETSLSCLCESLQDWVLLFRSEYLHENPFPNPDHRAMNSWVWLLLIRIQTSLPLTGKLSRILWAVMMWKEEWQFIVAIDRLASSHQLSIRPTVFPHCLWSRGLFSHILITDSLHRSYYLTERPLTGTFSTRWNLSDNCSLSSCLWK